VTATGTTAYELCASGSGVEAIFPDSNSRDAFGVNMMATHSVNMMDPSTRPPAARAGYGQGRAFPKQLTEFWR
jgi:NTE family protein